MLYFYFDEAGDKGYVDKATDKSLFGIVAGIVVEDEGRTKILSKLKPILDELKVEEYKKIHSSEVFKGDKNEELFNRIYHILESTADYEIIFEGAYSLGVKKHIELSQSIQGNQQLPSHIKLITKKKEFYFTANC